MPVIDVTAKAHKNLKLKIGADEFQKHVSSIAFVPSSSQVTWQGGTPDATLTDSSPSTWTAQVTLVQDWETTDSLANFLLAHEGESAEVEYQPLAGGAFTIYAEITLTAPQIGGVVNQFNESTVTMGCTRKPSTTAPVGE